MKVRSNKIEDIIKYYKTQLTEFYDEKEAESLVKLVVRHYLNLSNTELILNYNKPVNESDMLKIHFAYRDLKAYKPIQYILGETEFYDLKFIVNDNVLIPRPETEELVDWIIKDHKNSNQTLKILDIGTGSGAIAISLKKNLPDSDVTAIDISAKALEVAKINAEKNSVEIIFEELNILGSNAYSKLSKFDVIVSNPPYVRNSEKSKMQKNVLDYEPQNALFVEDNDPLMFYKAITNFAKTNLNQGGELYLEINEALATETVLLLKEKGFSNIELRQDINWKDRMVKCEIRVLGKTH
ncbi:MAG: peptide chain release factor N(5)-glutamine methyltransferase [Saprospiraceae bacterium]|nr:peptide chain release factor N(5)-glutamine methyltransferase [Saprospiraceae bacterium]